MSMLQGKVILLVVMSWLTTVAAYGQDKEFHDGKKEKTRILAGEAALPVKAADSKAKGLNVSLATLQRLHANLKVKYSAPGNNYPLDVIAIGNVEAMNL